MNDLDDVIEEVRFAASQLPPDDMLHDELRFLVELSDTRARLAHEQTTNANLLRALAEANDLNVVRRTAMVNLHEHIEKLDARLAEAERDRPALLACERYIRNLDAADEELHAEDCSQDYESDDPMENCDCYRIDCRRLIEAIDAARAADSASGGDK